jgi:hypothetical protein
MPPTATIVPSPSPRSSPTAAPNPTPTPLGELTTLDKHGFRIVLHGRVEIQEAGLTGPDASPAQGQMVFPYGGVTVILVWLPAADLTPADILGGTYEILRTFQPSVTFDARSEGEVTVGGEQGVFGGFTAAASGPIVGGGLIGAWLCSAAGTAFALTVTGADSTTVQVRFNELLSSFQCASPGSG